ncbi:MAG: glutamate--tRNA ligase [Candidatus Hodarchaeota archaeon]
MKRKSQEEISLEASELSQLCEQFTLANRVEFGKADLASTMKRILGERPALRSQGKKIAKIVAAAVERVNAFPEEEFEIYVQSNYPNLLEVKKEPKKKKEPGLPPLPDITKGEIITRLPPEPSGYPHIGHAYAFFINHYYARKYNGRVILRFEDTNPAKVDLEYYDAFREALKFLEISWDEEIIVSNHLDTYYKYADQLVNQGHAYVCECPVKTVRELRESMQACVHRNVLVEESENQWQKMKDGFFEEGQATLRLKLSMDDPNPVLRDPAIMRVTYVHHPIQGNKYLVWPLYDFTVSLEDGLRGITHVFRSEEFDFRIPLQNRIRDLIGLKNPQIIHFSRLRISGTPVQKRLIRPLIEDGMVSGWDDIRLSTIAGLRRRGILPKTIQNLVFELQLSTAQSEMDWGLILAINRKLADPVANHYFAVVDPVYLHISDAQKKQVRLPLHPDDKERGERVLTTGQEFYLDSSDVNNFEVGTELRLKDLYNIQIDEIQIDRVIAHLTGGKTNLNVPKIHWVPVKEAIQTRLSFPGVLFRDGLFNPDSLVMKTGWGEKNLQNAKIGDIIQLERLGLGLIDTKTNQEIQINMCEKWPESR